MSNRLFNIHLPDVSLVRGALQGCLSAHFRNGFAACRSLALEELGSGAHLTRHDPRRCTDTFLSSKTCLSLLTVHFMTAESQQEECSAGCCSRHPGDTSGQRARVGTLATFQGRDAKAGAPGTIF